MKTKILLALIPCMTLVACGGNTPTSTTSSSTSSSTSQPAQDLDPRLFGTWYVHSNMMGVIPQNTTFTISPNKTLQIANVTCTYTGQYESYKDTYKFVYRTMYFVVSYDADEPGVDWGYFNTNEQDAGFARSTPFGAYDYIGPDWPMEMINSYIGTNGTIPAYTTDTYYLRLNQSLKFECPTGNVEIHNANLSNTQAYVDSLSAIGYTFYNYSGTVQNNKFVVGYDKDKTYSVRIIHFGDDEEADIFVYKYNEEIVE